MAVTVFFSYSNSLKGVAPTTLSYHQQLKDELVNKGYQPTLLVISAKRTKWHNSILTSFGAAKKSQHLSGTAIDIMVLDINEDGQMDEKDVSLVVEILEKLIGSNGGIGTYKTEKLIWNRQMVHFDSRGHKARWNR